MAESSGVVHPSHYNMYDGFEVIDLAEQMTYNEGNAVKYIARGPFKGTHIKDLEKARYSIKKEIKRLKRKAKKYGVTVDELKEFEGRNTPPNPTDVGNDIGFKIPIEPYLFHNLSKSDASERLTGNAS